MGIKNVIWVFIFVIEILSVKSWKFKNYPYADMSMEQKVAYDGYPLKTYKVTTEDNYILTIYRIPYGRTNLNVSNRSPVLLLHGLGAGPEMFILLGANRSLAYNLADEGFDVWLFNARGAKKSQGHKYLNLNMDKSYWKFGFHEVSIYDLPANIDFIINKTQQKIFVIGHSQGNTCFFIMLAEKPEYNEKVKFGFAYAQGVKLNYDNPIINLILYAADILKSALDFLGVHEVVPYNLQSIKLFTNLCREQSYLLELCNHILSIIGTNPSRILEKDLIPVVASAAHSRVSTFQLFHFMQIMRSGYFGQYNYGAKKNIQLYGNSTPPQYDLKKITTPVGFFCAPKDDLGKLKGTEDAIKELPNVVFHEIVEYEFFNHIDFLFGKNASELVYQKTIKVFQDFDNVHNFKHVDKIH